MGEGSASDKRERMLEEVTGRNVVKGVAGGSGGGGGGGGGGNHNDELKAVTMTIHSPIT